MEKSSKRHGRPSETGLPKHDRRGTHYPWKKRSEIRYAKHLEYIRMLARQEAAESSDLAIDDCLPSELLAGVFSFLPVSMLCSTIMLVSKRWLSLARDNSLWKYIVSEKFGKYVGRYAEDPKSWFEICHRLMQWHWDTKVNSCIRLSNHNLMAKNTIASIDVPRKDKQSRMVLKLATPIDSGIHHFSLTIVKSKKANIGFGLANRNIACSTVARGFNENNNGIGYYSVGALFVNDQGVVHIPSMEVPKFGEGDVLSMLLDMEENILRFFKWADRTGEGGYAFCSAKIRIKRGPKEPMHVVCLLKGNAKVAIEYWPIHSVLDKL